MSEVQALLSCKKIIKEFNGNRVLKEVDFDIRPAEIHSLLGENGAGKSTLIKIISGVYPLDGGQIYIEGKPVEINSRQDSLNNGIAVVYQDFSVMRGLTVAQNVMIGREDSKFGFLKKKAMNEKVQALIDKYHFHLRADQPVNDLSVAECQMVEILKALSVDAKLLILDEPTAALSVSESEALFEIIYSLKAQGVSILYISHRMDEVYMLSDRITVLRDGECAGVFEKDEIDPVRIVRCIVGKDVTANRSSNLREMDTPIVLEVRHLSSQDKFQDISLQVHAGEILGIGGLVGAGRTEFLRAIYGLDSYDSGEILLNGTPLSHNIHKNMEAGIGFISEDRHGEGMIPNQSIAVNATMINYKLAQLGPFIRNAKELKIGESLIHAMNVKPPNPKQLVVNLSGGNQQKVVVGKWLQRDTKLLLIDEPTVGVDIGAKAEIYSIIRDLASKGVAIILVSSDVEELLNISTRIVLFYRGSIIREYHDSLPTMNEIMVVSSGITDTEVQNP